MNNVDVKLIDTKEAISIEPNIKVLNPNYKYIFAKETKVGNPMQVM